MQFYLYYFFSVILVFKASVGWSETIDMKVVMDRIHCSKNICSNEDPINQAISVELTPKQDYAFGERRFKFRMGKVPHEIYVHIFKGDIDELNPRIASRRGYGVFVSVGAEKGDSASTYVVAESLENIWEVFLDTSHLWKDSLYHSSGIKIKNFVNRDADLKLNLQSSARQLFRSLSENQCRL